MARTRQTTRRKPLASESRDSTRGEAAKVRQKLKAHKEQLRRYRSWQQEAALDPGRLVEAMGHGRADVGEIASGPLALVAEDKSVTSLRGKAVIPPQLPAASFAPWFSRAAAHQLVTSFAAFSQLRLRMLSGVQASKAAEEQEAELVHRVRDLAARARSEKKDGAEAASKKSSDGSGPAVEKPASMPPIAEMGIRGILSFLRGAAASHPELCAEPLCLLLETLSGFDPQGLGSGSRDLCEALEAVFTVATAPTESVGDRARELAFSALVALAVARGEVDALLSAVSKLLAADPRPFQAAAADRTRAPLEGVGESKGGGGDGDEEEEEEAAAGGGLRLSVPPPLSTLLHVSHSRSSATLPRLNEAAVAGTAPAPADVTAAGVSAIAVHGDAYLAYSALAGRVYRVERGGGEDAPHVAASADAPRWEAADEATRRRAEDAEAGKPTPTTLSSPTGAAAVCLGATLLLRCGGMEPGRFVAFDAVTLEQQSDVLQSSAREGEEEEKAGAAESFSGRVGTGPFLAAPMTTRELVVVDTATSRPGLRARRFVLRGNQLVPHRAALYLPPVATFSDAEIGAAAGRDAHPTLGWTAPTGLDSMADCAPVHASCNDDVALVVTRGGTLLARGDLRSLVRKDCSSGVKGHHAHFSPLPSTTHLQVKRVAVSPRGAPAMQHALLLLTSGRLMEVGHHQWVRERNPALREVGGPLAQGPRVVDIATSTRCSAAVTEDWELYAWGDVPLDVVDASNGVPRLLVTGGESVHSIALGDSHIAAVTVSGHVLAAGSNDAGQCGFAPPPTALVALASVPGIGGGTDQGAAVGVACGADFTVVVTDTGAALAFGSNAEGQLGIAAGADGGTAVTKPTKVPLPDDAFVVQAACGVKRTVLLTADNRLFVFGADGKGAGSMGRVETAPGEASPRSLAHVCASNSMVLTLKQPETGPCDRLDRLSLLCHRGALCLAVADPLARPPGSDAKRAALYGQMHVHSAEDGSVVAAEPVDLPLPEAERAPDTPAGESEEKAAVEGGEEAGKVEQEGEEEEEKMWAEEKAASPAGGGGAAGPDDEAQKREWAARDKRLSQALETAATEDGVAMLPYDAAEFTRRLKEETPLFRARLSAHVAKGARLRSERDVGSAKSWCGSWMKGVVVDVVEEEGQWVRISLADRFTLMKTRKAAVHEHTWCLREMEKDGEKVSLVDAVFRYKPRPAGAAREAAAAHSAAKGGANAPSPAAAPAVADDAGAFRLAMDPATGAVSVLARGSTLLSLHRPPSPVNDRAPWALGRERAAGAEDCVREGMLLLQGGSEQSPPAALTNTGSAFVQELIEAAQDGTPLSPSHTAVALLSCLGDAALRRCGGQRRREAVVPGSAVKGGVNTGPQESLRRHRMITELSGWHCGRGQVDAICVTVDQRVVLHGYSACLGKSSVEGDFKVKCGDEVLGETTFHGPPATSPDSGLLPVLLDPPVVLEPEKWYTLQVEYTHGSKIGAGEGASAEQSHGGVQWRFQASPVCNNGTSPSRGQFVALTYSLPPSPRASKALLVEKEEASVECTVLSLPALSLTRLVNGPAAYRKALALLAFGARQMGAVAGDSHCAATVEYVCACMRVMRAQRSALSPPGLLHILHDAPSRPEDQPQVDGEESEEDEQGPADDNASPEDEAVAHATLVWDTHEALVAVIATVRRQLQDATLSGAAAGALKQAAAEALALYHYLWPRLFPTWALRTALLRSLTARAQGRAGAGDAPAADPGVRKILLLVAMSVLSKLRGTSRLVLSELRHMEAEGAQRGAEAGAEGVAEGTCVSAGAGAGTEEGSTQNAAGAEGDVASSPQDAAFSETMLQFMAGAGLASGGSGEGSSQGVVSSLVELASHDSHSSGASEQVALAAAASALLAATTNDVVDACKDTAAGTSGDVAEQMSALTRARHSVARFLTHGPRTVLCAGASEAVVVKVDRAVLLLGVELYGGEGENSAAVELFERKGMGAAGTPVARSEGTITISPGGDRGALYFARPARLEPHTEYILSARVWGGARPGGRDESGAKGTDGAQFTFTSTFTSESADGRSQFPALLYKQVEAGAKGPSKPQSAGASKGADDWVWNPRDCSDMVAIHADGMQMERNVAGSGTNGVRGTWAMEEGEYEWVVRLETSAGSHTMVGLSRPGTALKVGSFTEMFGRAEGEAALKNDGTLWQNGRRISSCRWNWKANTSVRVRYDADSGALTFFDHENGKELVSTKLQPNAEVYPAVSTTFGTGRMTLVERRVLRGGHKAADATKSVENTRDVLRAAKAGRVGQRGLMRLGGLAEDGERQRVAAYAPMLSLFRHILSRAEAALDGLDGAAPAAHGLLTQIVPLALLRLSQMASASPQVVRALDSPLRSLLERASRVEEEGAEGSGDDTASHPAFYRRVVETPHPYPPALVQSWSLRFPAAVKWMVVWVDPDSATLQPEDGMQLFADKKGECPVSKRFFGQRQAGAAEGQHTEWPSTPLVVPGNELHVSFTSASAYIKDAQLSRYGFRCVVTGHALPSAADAPVAHLRRELSFLLALHASESALSKEPASARAAAAEALAAPLLRLRPLSRGVDLDAAGTAVAATLGARVAAAAEGAADAAGANGAQRLRRAMRAMTGARAFAGAGAAHSQREFLRDFIDMRPGSLGALLACWLEKEEAEGGERAVSVLEEARRAAEVEAHAEQLRGEQQAVEVEAKSFAELYVKQKEQVALVRGVVPHCGLLAVLRVFKATSQGDKVDVNRAAEQLMAQGEKKEGQDPAQSASDEQRLTAETNREIEVLEGTLDAAKLRAMREEAMAKKVAEVRRELGAACDAGGDDAGGDDAGGDDAGGDDAGGDEAASAAEDGAAEASAQPKQEVVFDNAAPGKGLSNTDDEKPAALRGSGGDRNSHESDQAPRGSKGGGFGVGAPSQFGASGFGRPASPNGGGGFGFGGGAPVAPVSPKGGGGFGFGRPASPKGVPFGGGAPFAAPLEGGGGVRFRPSGSPRRGEFNFGSFNFGGGAPAPAKPEGGGGFSFGGGAPAVPASPKGGGGFGFGRPASPKGVPFGGGAPVPARVFNFDGAPAPAKPAGGGSGFGGAEKAVGPGAAQAPPMGIFGRGKLNAVKKQQQQGGSPFDFGGGSDPDHRPAQKRRSKKTAPGPASQGSGGSGGLADAAAQGAAGENALEAALPALSKEARRLGIPLSTNLLPKFMYGPAQNRAMRVAFAALLWQTQNVPAAAAAARAWAAGLRVKPPAFVPAAAGAGGVDAGAEGEEVEDASPVDPGELDSSVDPSLLRLSPAERQRGRVALTRVRALFFRLARDVRPTMVPDAQRNESGVEEGSGKRVQVVQTRFNFASVATSSKLLVPNLEPPAAPNLQTLLAAPLVLGMLGVPGEGVEAKAGPVAGKGPTASLCHRGDRVARLYGVELPRPKLVKGMAAYSVEVTRRGSGPGQLRLGWVPGLDCDDVDQCGITLAWDGTVRVMGEEVGRLDCALEEGQRVTCAWLPSQEAVLFSAPGSRTVRAKLSLSLAAVAPVLELPPGGEVKLFALTTNVSWGPGIDVADLTKGPLVDLVAADGADTAEDLIDGIVGRAELLLAARPAFRGALRARRAKPDGAAAAPEEAQGARKRKAAGGGAGAAEGDGKDEESEEDEEDEEDDEDEESERGAEREELGMPPAATPPLSRQPSLQEQEDEAEARRLAEAEKRSTHAPEADRPDAAAAAAEGDPSLRQAGAAGRGADRAQSLYSLDSEEVTSRLDQVEDSKARSDVLSILVSVVPRSVVEEGLQARTMLAEQRAAGLRDLGRMLSALPAHGPREDVLWFCSTVLHHYFPGVDKRAGGAAAKKADSASWRKELRGASPDAVQTVLSAVYELLGAALQHLQSPLAAKEGSLAGEEEETAGAVAAGAGAGSGSADSGRARVHPSIVAMRQLQALRCWSLSFPRRDDTFLHRSGLFLVLKELMGGVSGAGSPDVEANAAEWGGDERYCMAPVEVLQDATADLESVGPGSAKQRGSLLVDGSTETFWESIIGRGGDRDEARKARMVGLVRKPGTAPFHAIGVCLDGGRDRESVVNRLALLRRDEGGKSRKLDKVKVADHYTGWLVLAVPEDAQHDRKLTVELYGPSHVPVRVRAIRPLRWKEEQEADGGGASSPTVVRRSGAAESPPSASGAAPGEAATRVDEAAVWRRVVEAEALRLFRSLASRAFEGLIRAQGEGKGAAAAAAAGAGAGAGDGDVPKAPEQPPAMPGRAPSEASTSSGRSRMQRQLSRQQSRELEELTTLLFDTKGSKLSSLQEHLFDLMAEELASEAREFEALVRQDPAVAGSEVQGVAPEEDVEASDDLEREDAYCFELLVLLESLGAAGSGLAYVCQPVVLQTLFSLFRHGTARVQRAAFAILRRTLPHLSLRGLDDVLGRPNVSVRPLRKVRTEAMKRAERERAAAEEEAPGPGPALPYGGDIMAAMRAQDREAIRVIMMARNGNGASSDGGDAPQPPQPSALSREASSVSATGGDGGGKEGRAVVAVLLLHCAKGLETTLRSRSRGARSGPRVSTLAPDSPILGGRLHPTVTRQLVALLRGLRDHSSPQFHPRWAEAIDCVCKDVVLGLPLELGEDASPAHVEGIVALWVALAALWVTGENHADVFAETEEDSAASKNGTTEVGRPVFCDNHEDGETLASRRCSTCMQTPNLCDACFEVLHLPKKMRGHESVALSPTGTAGEAFHFDFADGAGRARLDWLTLVVDTAAGKAIVELRSRSRSSKSSGSTCRFCEVELTAENRCTEHAHLPGLQDVCSSDECVEAAAHCCGKMLPCKHPCLGVRGEEQCLPCMHGCASGEGAAAKYDKEAHCRVCLDQLGSGPVVELTCGHVFHFGCVKRLLEGRWDGPRITFGFMKCPLCAQNMEHPQLAELVEPLQKLEEEVKRKAVMRAEYEGSDKSPDVMEPGGRFHNDLAGYAMDRYAYYMCCKCGTPYFGGERVCGAAADVVFDASELVCGSCSPATAGVKDCPVHGKDYIEWKCRFCCSVATFFCFGTTHFCSVCHTEPGRMTSWDKEDLPKCPCGPLGKKRQGACPLGVEHPPTGEEYCLGCGLCRNAHTF